MQTTRMQTTPLLPPFQLLTCRAPQTTAIPIGPSLLLPHLMPLSRMSWLAWGPSPVLLSSRAASFGKGTEYLETYRKKFMSTFGDMCIDRRAMA